MDIGTILLDRYEILEKIGEGGMAIVYKARCHTLDRFVAIKVLKSEYAEDEEFVKKFMRECQSAAKLNHPNIVGIYDFHNLVIDGEPIYCIVMEYVDGKTLKDIITEEVRIPEKYAVNIAIQILEALKEAHNHGVIHRDIKPHNILITKNGVVKVADFGIARATTNHTMTTTMDAIGSVHYFSPEQARGAFTDQRTDIYSFGIVLYEMLTGKRPFVGENPVSVAMKHIQEDIIPPGEVVEGISEQVESVVLKCTMKKQAERYQNVDEIIADLTGLNNEAKRFMSSAEIEKEFDQTRIMPQSEIEEIIKKEEQGKMKKKKHDEDYDDFDEDDEPIFSRKFKEKRDGSGHNILPIILGLLVAFVLTTGLYIGFTKVKSIRESNKIQEVVAPNLIGMSEVDAKRSAEELKLIFEVEKEVSDGTKPYGVISQRPQPGIKIKENSKVLVTMNIDEGLPKLPDFVGKKIEDIEVEVKTLGLKVDVKIKEDSNEPENQILSQDPNAGTPYKEGDTIYLTISGGDSEEEFEMTNLIGMNYEQAKTICMDNGLAVEIERRKSEETQKDVVIEQSILNGEMVKKGDSIKLVVSDGKEEDEESENDNPDQDEENEKPVEKPEETEPVKPFNIAVPIPQDIPESVVKIASVIDGNRTIVFENTYKKEEEVVYIDVKNQKVGTILELYINETYIDTFEIK